MAAPVTFSVTPGSYSTHLIHICILYSDFDIKQIEDGVKKFRTVWELAHIWSHRITKIHLDGGKLWRPYLKNARLFWKTHTVEIKYFEFVLDSDSSATVWENPSGTKSSNQTRSIIKFDYNKLIQQAQWMLHYDETFFSSSYLVVDVLQILSKIWETHCTFTSKGLSFSNFCKLNWSVFELGICPPYEQFTHMY